jgi:BCD family chlorophyll transporter-like MFS transporter
MAGLVAAAALGPPWPLGPNVFTFGVCTGAFSIAVIASMMSLATEGGGSREGVRMGLWGAAQAVAFASGGFLGTVLADLARLATGSAAGAYAFVFGAEAAAFLAACGVALGVRFGTAPARPAALTSA